MEIYSPQTLLDKKKLFKDKKILFHVCCGVCAVHTAEVLKSVFKEVVLFFYNPNIYPKEEYQRRLETMKKVAEIHQLKLMEGRYEPEEWAELAAGLEKEPEGGKRCEICYEKRLRETAWLAKDENFDYFTTTLTVSPHKKSLLINQIGDIIARESGAEFLQMDFKKNDGFRKSSLLAKEYQLYHQNYCGCVFSRH